MKLQSLPSGIFLLLLITVSVLSCELEDEGEQFPYHFHIQNTHIETSFRGVAATNDSVCWISGSNGVILRTTNEGKTWKKLSIPGHEKSDFRDIEAFDENNALVMAIGSPAKIFRTNNGGKTWWLTYFNDHPDIFLDGMAFLDDKVGIAFGDAIDNKIIVLKTYDGGNRWNLLPDLRLPTAVPGEGGFAASGTSVIAHGDSEFYIGLGFPRGRLIYSHDAGDNWDFYLTGLGNGDSSRGVYSLDFDSNGNGIAVGGDWKNPDDNHLVAATTHDKGLHWEIITENPPNGYRSAVKFIPNTSWAMCTGPNGTDVSQDKGKTWFKAKTGGNNALSFSKSGKVGWLVGNNGRLIKIKALSSSSKNSENEDQTSE